MRLLNYCSTCIIENVITSMVRRNHQLYSGYVCSGACYGLLGVTLFW
nr:MAG TPA: hypothetical protein [Caudoviricetes sp.]